MRAVHPIRLALAPAVACLLVTLPALAQTVGTLIPAGSSPSAIAVNPNTNRIYVANDASDNVTVIDGSSGTATTVAVGARPSWIAVNPETNRIYVANFGRSPAGPTLSILTGATSSVSATLNVGDVGWTAINPITNKTYVIRYGNGDEVNIVQGETYVNTAATRSYKPVAISLNPYTNTLYIVHEATGDVVAIDASVDSSTNPGNEALYPPLLCPNGSGGFKPSPGRFDPDPGPCINIPDPAVGVAVNPVTNKIYAVSSTASNQISVINGVGQANPHTFISLTPPGVSGVAKAIAVNPVTNKVYAAFAGHIVIVDAGNANAMTVIPSGSAGGGPVGIGIDTGANRIYVPNADGTLKVIDGATNVATATLSIPAGAVAIAVNPVTHRAYVAGPTGVTPIIGAAGDTPLANPLNTTITQSATGANPTFRFDAISGFTPATPIPRVYYQLDSTTGAWTAASGSGPFTAAFTALSAGSHTLYAFATDGQDAPLTGAQSNPLVGNVASLAFTITGASPANPFDFNADGKTDIIWSNTADGNHFVWYMNGNTLVSDAFLAQVDPAWAVQGVADFNGDGKPDIVWRNIANGSTFVWYMNGTSLLSDAFLFSVPPEWVVQGVADFNGDGKPDFLLRNSASGLAFVWFFNDAAPIGDQYLFTIDPAWKVEAVGDMNADSQPDLLFRNVSSGLAFAWFTQHSGGNVSLAGSSDAIFSIDPAWEVVQLADWNGDGGPDLLFRNRNSGLVFVWYMNGTTLGEDDYVTQIGTNWEIVPHR